MIFRVQYVIILSVHVSFSRNISVFLVLSILTFLVSSNTLVFQVHHGYIYMYIYIYIAYLLRLKELVLRKTLRTNGM
jgi:uncharacterized membrane protein